MPAAQTRIGAAALAVLLASSPCSALMYTAIAPILPQLAAHLGGGGGVLYAQLIMSMPSIGLMVGGPVIGWGAELVGPRPVLLAALSIYAVAGSAGLYLDGVGALLASRLLLGLAVAGIGTSSLTILGQHLSGARRSRLIGYQIAFGAGVGLASTLAAGSAAEIGGWRAPFAFYLVAVVLLVMAVVVLPAGDRFATVTAGDASAPGRLWRLYLSAVPLYAAIFVTSTQAAFVLTANGVTHPTAQAPIIGLASLFNGVGAWNYGRLRGRLGPQWTFRSSLILLAAGMLMLGASHDRLSAGLGCGLAGLGSGLVVPYLMNRVLDEAPANARGRAIGLLYTAQYLGSFLNPILFAPLIALWGIHAAVSLAGAALLLSVGTLALGARAETASINRSSTPSP
jgi:MFS family permease